jgi:hypothetical protein
LDMHSDEGREGLCLSLSNSWKTDIMSAWC